MAQVLSTHPQAPRPLTDPAGFSLLGPELEAFNQEFASFVPANAFDAHAHLYDFAHLEATDATDAVGRSRPVGFDLYHEQQRRWMGELAPKHGLFFPFPKRRLHCATANQFLLDELRGQPNSRGLMMITPQDDPTAVEDQIRAHGWSGFKVYHLFAAREDTPNADIGEYLPDWAWELADRHGLLIMLHMVKQRSLADSENQKYIRTFCRRYPRARLVLAHAARGFCAHHTTEGIASLDSLDNVYFDTSAICESLAFEAVLRHFGPTRLLFGSDFPVSEAHGRCVTLGDGFHWIYRTDHTDWPQGEPTLIGIESLRALKQACSNLSLNASDIARIFKDNARELLCIEGQGAERQGDAFSGRHDAEQSPYVLAKRLMPGGTQLLSKRPEMYAPEVWPPYFQEARGIEITTTGGRRVLDFTTTGIGSCLLGYAHPHVVKAVTRRVQMGAMSSLNSPEEVELAQVMLELHPWAQQARFARAGGEALAIAARIARAATGRDVIAFCGYHGWQDWYLAANLLGDEALTGHLLPGLAPAGVPRGLQGTALPFLYNDLESLQRIVREHGLNLAAVVMEPTRSVDPQPGFLEAVRSICDESGARLVFDEVTSGFRLHRAGVHLKYGVFPDLAVFAKALGNGHPIAAVLGRAATMSAAQGSFISSTYWTESVGPTAALATLDVLRANDAPAYVATIAENVRLGLSCLARQNSVPLKVGGHPALTTFGFDNAHGMELLTLWTSRMLDRGFLAGGSFYPTLAHTQEHIEDFLAAAAIVMTELGELIAKDGVTGALTTPVKHAGFARLN